MLHNISTLSQSSLTILPQLQELVFFQTIQNKHNKSEEKYKKETKLNKRIYTNFEKWRI